MFTISFDLVVSKIHQHHPKGVPQAYADVAKVLARYDFARVQGSVYATETGDLVNLFRVVNALRELPWLGQCVGNIRAFRMELGSDFTSFVKGDPA